MTDSGQTPSVSGSAVGHEAAGERLHSWKAIANYLGRSEKTARRWEENESLPVHRLLHEKRGSVYAFQGQLDAWLETRKISAPAEDASILVEEPGPPLPSDDSVESFAVDSTADLVGRSRSSSPTDAPPSYAMRWLLLGILIGSAVVSGITLLFFFASSGPRSDRRVLRITDSVGLEDSPAISPDGKAVAFVALAGNRRQIWVRLVAGGQPLQVTHDDADHQRPRWSPDSNFLIYYAASGNAGQVGTLWEIPALGGTPRHLASASSGGDISHDGLRVAFFEARQGVIRLVIVGRNGEGTKLVAVLSGGVHCEYPRWSPDDRSIALQMTYASFDSGIYVVPSAGGNPHPIIQSNDLRGMSWLRDGSGLVYSSSSGSTILYPPAFHLHFIRANGSGDRALTFGDLSYVEPDIGVSGQLVVSMVHSRSDLWQFPVTGSAEANTAAAIRITEQTAQIQTPSLSPRGDELVYISDNGGHGNLWVKDLVSAAARQITFTHRPEEAVGAAAWSPVSNQILFIRAAHGHAQQWLVDSDGGNLRKVIDAGVWASWSPDGRFIYYVALRNGHFWIEKVSPGGGPPVVVRTDDAVAPALSNSSFFYASLLKDSSGGWDYELRRAPNDTAVSEPLVRIAGDQVPVDSANFSTLPSPDDKWLALPLTNGVTTNLWVLPALGGPMRQVTDFHNRAIVIARRVAWSQDSRHIFAVVAECESDVALLEGILGRD